jgi:L-asparaginase
MMETAALLKESIDDKLIILTGSMRPERFSNSDAPINLGCAIATANLMEKGIFIAMHGIVKENSEIGRNLETGQFY